MLSRSTGCRQKTSQARQSACRWITITTCLFIHIFICVFVFSLHCEGDKKCWLRRWCAATRKHLLCEEVVSPSTAKVGAGQEGNEAPGQIVSRVWSVGLFAGCQVKTKAGLTVKNQVATVRGVAEPRDRPPLMFDWFGLWGLIQPLRWKATVTEEANRHSDIICHILSPQRGSMPIL